MNGYAIHSIDALIQGNPYVGRGIVLGVTADGTKACAAYFIMGRSENSRNRVFYENADGEVYTRAFDESKVEDPSLIIYAALRRYENNLIVTNGDQTDTVYDGLAAGKTFSASLESRCFEPDAPNFTPRISGLLTFADGSCSYQMSILKSIDAAGSACTRQTFAYPAAPGLGHFIHTYVTDGNPLPTFEGEPERVAIPNDVDAFAGALWNALDANNKISLYVCYTDLATGEVEKRLFNKNAEETK
ncbi:MAG: IMP cyclohydrolase [Clostridia bacterium]|nr:IMP cyclohydrolase [Clostridia bacterium]